MRGIVELKEKKLGPKLILWSFIIICYFWFIWILSGISIEEENHENRNLATRPQFGINNYLSFSNDFTAYVDDNMPFRSLLIELNNRIDFFVFDTSCSKHVVKGKDGWLFYSSTVADIQGDNLYTPDELEKIKNDVLITKEWFDSQGIEFVIFIGPNKNTIYSDYMPSFYRISDGETRVSQMVNYLRDNTDVKIIFPVDEILTARNEYSEYQYYLKLDTHWNYLGGYFGSVPLLNQLNAEVTDLSDLTIEEVNEPVFLWHGYDEADLLGLSDVLNEDVNYRISGGLIDSIVYEGDARNNLSDFEGVVRTVSDSDDFRKVFFVRDSFGECMTPYLASSFHEVYSVHDDSFTKNMIDEEQPDIFIYESVERADFLGAFNYNNW